MRSVRRRARSSSALATCGHSAIDSLSTGTASIAELLAATRPPLAGTVDQLNRLAPLLDQNKALVETALQKAPNNYRKLVRLGAYGAFILLQYKHVAPWFGVGFRLNRLDVLVVLTAACAWFVTNYSILIVGVRLRYGVAWGQVFNRTFGYEALSTGALLVLAPLLVGAPSPWVMLFLLVPLFAVSQMGKLSIEQHQQSRVDPLTGLMNRRALTVEVDELIARGGRRGFPAADRRLALLLLDLDRFKHVNDALGHAVGDQLLAEVAHRLVTTAARTTGRSAWRRRLADHLVVRSIRDR